MTYEPDIMSQLRSIVESSGAGHWSTLNYVLNADDLDTDEMQACLDAYENHDYELALQWLNQYLEQGDRAWWSSLRALDIDHNPIIDDEPFVLFDRDPTPQSSNKTDQIKMLLRYMKHNQMDLAASQWMILRRNGFNWPELSVIEKSLRDKNALKESSLQDVNIQSRPQGANKREYKHG